ncbi:MAG: hypothetical protein RL196_1426 [Actinomycetota bacterium]|jgi:hypothetical protein
MRKSIEGAWHWAARVAASKYFFFATCLAFVAMSVFFAVSVVFPHYSGVINGVVRVTPPNRVPDEFRHIANILLYVQRDFWAGPVISNATPETLRLGEVSRFPSYFYYYAMSFFVRWFDFGGSNYYAVVLTLRLVTAVTGLLTLIVVRKSLLRLKFSMATANITVFALLLTGRFVWQSAGVSYDMPSMLLFAVFCHYSIKFIQSRNLWLVVPLLVFTFLNSVVKYTYLPFQIGYLALILGWFLFTRKKHTGPIWVRPASTRFWLWIIATAISFALFAERILQNILVWRQIEPGCDKIQTYANCFSLMGIFRRNESAAAAVANGSAHDLMNPFTYVVRWVNNIYQSIFFYRGWSTHNWYVIERVIVVGLLATAVAVVLFVIGAIRNGRSPERLFVIAVVVSYVVGVFAFNAKTYLNLHVTFAASGRYLLPILGFFFAFGVLGIRELFKIKSIMLKRVVLISLGALVVLFWWWHNPLVAYDPLYHSKNFWGNMGPIADIFHRMILVKRYRG